MRPFVIFGIQRSGTTLLRTLLDSHPNLECRGELFKRGRRRGQHSEPGYREYLRERPWRFLSGLVLGQSQVVAYLDATFAAAKARPGFKLMLDQALREPRILDYMAERSGDFIILRRRNVLHVLISRLTARARGRYTATAPVPPLSIYLPAAGLRERLRRIEKEQILLDRKIPPGVKNTMVTYESLQSDREATCNEVLRFLNVNPAPLSSPLVKLNPALEQVLANYREVAEALAPTPYAQFL